jgi:hypothetical protein
VPARRTRSSCRHGLVAVPSQSPFTPETSDARPDAGAIPIQGGTMNKTPPGAAVERGRLPGIARMNAGAAQGASPVALPTRARFGIQQTWPVPVSSNAVYVTPFAGAAAFNDGDITMNHDYTMTVNTTGLYILSISFDWADNPNQQVGLRINGIARADAGNKPGVFKAGELTVVKNKNDRLGQYDVSSTNCALTSRYAGTWKIDAIGKNGIVSQDVTVSPPGIVGLGDVATAAHTGITTALGDAVAALVVTAKVIGPDTVRVTIWNSSQTHAVAVPSGTLNVLAMSAQTMTGDAPLGRSMMASASESLTQGDLIYGIFKSTQGGDQLLASPNTFIHIERWA